MTALTALLIQKGLVTQAEFAEALLAEAKLLDHGYEERFPGWRTSSDGLHMKMPEALETVRKMGFPP